MSDPTETTDRYAQARERERLLDAYRAAYREARTTRPSTGPTPRLRSVAAEIHKNTWIFDEPMESPDRFIAAIERDVDHELNIEAIRADIAAALNNVDQAVNKLRKLLQEAVDHDDHEFSYDLRNGVEATAFNNLKLNLTALRHIARDPDPGELA